MNKVFVFGIDGGSLAVIKELIKSGELPTFQKLIQNGTSGILHSTIPPHTAPGWVSAVTGVGPGNHGVYQFWDTQGQDYVGRFMGSRDWKSTPLWKVLNKAGLKTGVVNVPMTHPPCPMDGYIITWPLSNTLRYSYPESLLSEIAVQGGHYLPDISIMCHGEKEYVEKAVNITQKRVQTVKYLLKTYEWDFMMAVFPEVDRISHFYWHFWDENSVEYCPSASKEEKNAIVDMYRATDKALSEVLSILPEDTLLLVMSDHGFGAGEYNFNVQTFLMDKGFLFAKAWGYDTESTTDQGGSWFTYSKEGTEYEVDWTKTKAYMAAPGSYGVNINLKGRQRDGIVSREEFENVRTQVLEQLMTVRHPVSNEPIFREVVRSEDVYKGKFNKGAPDLILIPYDYGIMVNHNVVPGKWFSSPEQKGMHRQEGLIIAAGPGVKKNNLIHNAKLEDIFATVLNHFGLTVPDSSEGQVLQIYYGQTEADKSSDKIMKNSIKYSNIEESEGSCPEEKQSESSYSEDEQSEIEERLKSLGYL